MNTEKDGRNDFDFLVGTWKVHHRMLTQRLKGQQSGSNLKAKRLTEKL